MTAEELEKLIKVTNKKLNNAIYKFFKCQHRQAIAFGNTKKIKKYTQRFIKLDRATTRAEDAKISLENEVKSLYLIVPNDF